MGAIAAHLACNAWSLNGDCEGSVQSNDGIQREHLSGPSSRPPFSNSCRRNSSKRLKSVAPFSQCRVFLLTCRLLCRVVVHVLLFVRVSARTCLFVFVCVCKVRGAVWKLFCVGVTATATGHKLPRVHLLKGAELSDVAQCCGLNEWRGVWSDNDNYNDNTH